METQLIDAWSQWIHKQHIIHTKTKYSLIMKSQYNIFIRLHFFLRHFTKSMHMDYVIQWLQRLNFFLILRKWSICIMFHSFWDTWDLYIRHLWNLALRNVLKCFSCQMKGHILFDLFSYDHSWLKSSFSCHQIYHQSRKSIFIIGLFNLKFILIVLFTD